MERFRTPGAPGYERERPLVVRREDREHPAGKVQHPRSARVRTGAPVLYTEEKSRAPDFEERVLGAVLSGSGSGQDWIQGCRNENLKCTNMWWQNVIDCNKNKAGFSYRHRRFDSER